MVEGVLGDTHALKQRAFAKLLAPRGGSRWCRSGAGLASPGARAARHRRVGGRRGRGPGGGGPGRGAAPRRSGGQGRAGGGAPSADGSPLAAPAAAIAPPTPAPAPEAAAAAVAASAGDSQWQCNRTKPSAALAHRWAPPFRRDRHRRRRRRQSVPGAPLS